MIESVQVTKEYLRAYKPISINSIKLIYYAIAKAQCLAIGFRNSANGECSIREVIENSDIEITYKELKEYLSISKVTYRNISKSIEELKEIGYLEEVEINKNSIVPILSSEIIEMIVDVDQVKANNRVDLSVVRGFKKKYDINLYLYALTILRGNRGIITISIDNLKEILCGNETSQLDKMFYKRFVSDPKERINKQSDLLIATNREKDNIKLIVNKK